MLVQCAPLKKKKTSLRHPPFCGDPVPGDTTGLPLCLPGTDCASASQSFCIFDCTLDNNLKTDKAIFDITAPYANNPMAWSQSINAYYLGEINKLETINLVIDYIALGEQSNSALEIFSGELLNYGINQVAGAGVDQLEGARDQINQQIDILLGSAAPQPKP
jgi:hypothetical protein